MSRYFIFAVLLAVLPGFPAFSAGGNPKKNSKPAATPADQPRKWADWVEKDFPFFSSVLDARDVGEGFPKDNLTPRGIILNLGHNLWACFDTDLLRIACIWEGEEGKPPVTPVALAPGSYEIAGQKTKDGQDDLPKPAGKVWLANGIYPGWQLGDKPSFTDPREAGLSKDEVGRGAMIAASGKFNSVFPATNGVGINYLVSGVDVVERIFSESTTSGGAVVRLIKIAPHTERLVCLFGDRGTLRFSGAVGAGSGVGVRTRVYFTDAVKEFRAGNSMNELPRICLLSREAGQILLFEDQHKVGIAILPSEHEAVFALICASNQAAELRAVRDDPAKLALVMPNKQLTQWQQPEFTTAILSKKPDSYVLDDIPLPMPNPWKRNVRLADLDFLDDQGNAVGVTFDGDVWLIGGLKGDLEKVTWKRFASGLHEPMSVVVRKSEVFAFDRNGIWKLTDTNNDGECDRYEMFCNLFAQTAETREFPNSMKLGPKGELYISKGGQEGTTRGKHNGTVIKVAPDGKSFEVIGYGLRQPFIGVHPVTGLVTASDQQGNYVPSTPLHIISNHHFYGHLPTIAEKEKYPETITEPLTWIPHPVNPSGVTQVWLTGAKMGPLNDELLHIGYNRPEIFRVLMKGGATFQVADGQAGSLPETPKQAGSLPHFATVMSFWRDFDFPPLNAHVNPADGQVYVVGFQVWGTTAAKISGLARIRHTGAPRVLLKDCTPTDKGILLRFNAKLDAKLATDPASYSAERWNYKRTPEYGSPHLKLDGTPGQEWMTASSAYLSADGLSVLVGLPDMKAGVHQMRIGWGLKSVDGLKAENTAYFSPWELATFDAKAEGFGDITVDLTPRKAAVVADVKPTVEEGQRLYQMIGCMACHSTDGTTVGKVGPSWKGIFGSEREIGKSAGENLKKPLKVKADDAYLHESIINPGAKVVRGFEKFDAGMPIYAGILNESQIESLVLYIKSLK